MLTILLVLISILIGMLIQLYIMRGILNSRDVDIEFWKQMFENQRKISDSYKNKLDKLKSKK